MDDNGPLCEKAKSMTRVLCGMMFCTDYIMSRYQPSLPRSTIRVRAQDDKKQPTWAGGGLKRLRFWLGAQAAEDDAAFCGGRSPSTQTASKCPASNLHEL
ncbi:MAG: hypothetical protein NTX06_00925 [Proteobacteria bacterium]|nr:hypothetical protein [Pseudomonadota bacterium]